MSTRFYYGQMDYIAQLNAMDDIATASSTSAKASADAAAQSARDAQAAAQSAGVQVNSDWNATTGVAQILNKPLLATVATSGSYVDLINKPVFATVATSGDYNDLINKPAAVSQVNADWNAATGAAQILNKPTIPTATNQLTNNSGFITSTASITGNAATATKLQTVRTINGVNFDGSANITINAVDSTAREPAIAVGTATYFWKGNKTWAALSSSDVTTALGFTPYNSTNPSGYITSSASITGNAATATNVAWSGITSKPTTLSGYGITDAVGRSEFKSFGVQTYGGTGTTADFLAWLSGLGVFAYKQSSMKLSWSYAGNTDLTDTGFGTIETAGAVIEVYTGEGSGGVYGNIHVRLICPNAGGGAYQELIYNDQGSGYAPGWRKVWNSATLTNLNQLTNGPGYITASSSITGNAATATNADKLGGLPLGTVGSLGQTWGYVPRVHTDGVMEVGRYIDFHGTSADGADYSVRLDGGAGSGQLLLNGSNLLTAGNYNLYAPSLTGGGASGTWGINITGYGAGLNVQATNEMVLANGFGGGTLWLNYRGASAAISQVNVGSGMSNSALAKIVASNIDANGNTTGNSATSSVASKVQFVGGYAATFNWSGAGGQPSWLWGGNDSSNMYVYDPANFNVTGAKWLTTDRTNYSGTNVENNVVGQLMWKNYGNNHTIFDASNGTTPTGVAVDRVNSQVAWATNYPTLMGWNGSNTYGVRVDSSRWADGATSANKANTLSASGNTMTFNWSGQAGQPTWLWGANDPSNAYVYNPSAFSVAYAGSAGNTNSVSSATGGGYTWTGLSYWKRNVGATTSLTSQNTVNGPLMAYSDDQGPAFMSFHRGSQYAINMGLDYDNVIKIGGWSNPNTLMQLDMSGNVTFLNNVTAYSDERKKTNWRNVQVSFVSEWANVKSGIYDRIDNGETQVGLSAQAVQAVLPNAVSEDKDGFLSLNYGAAAAVASVELAKEVVELRKQVKQQAELIKLLIEKVGI